MEGCGSDSPGRHQNGLASNLDPGHEPDVLTAGQAAIHAPAAMHVVPKPWGREVWWAVADQYVGKRLEVTAGHCLSLQYHRRKHETLYFLSGDVRLQLGDERRIVGPGYVAVVPPGTVHRMEALTNAVIFEVSTPELQDVVRLEDRYGRAAALSATRS